MINYYELLEEKAREGRESLLHYLQTDKNLLWTVINQPNDITEIQIETWDEDNYNSEFLMSFNFNKFDQVI